MYNQPKGHKILSASWQILKKVEHLYDLEYWMYSAETVNCEQDHVEFLTSEQISQLKHS